MSDSDQSGEIYEQFDDEGVLPDLERPQGVTAHGVTADEAEEGANLQQRVDAELPEDAVDDDGDEAAESAAMHAVE